MRTVRSSFLAALESAKQQIEGATGQMRRDMGTASSDGADAERQGSAAFLARRLGRAASPSRLVKLNVARRQPLDATILTAIKDIEDSRDADERRAIEQAAADMAGVTQTVLDALRAETDAIGGGAATVGQTAGFLAVAQRGPAPEGGVRMVAAADPFPTVASIAQSMEERRDAAEQLESAEFLGMEAALAKAEVDMVRDAVAGNR